MMVHFNPFYFLAHCSQNSYTNSDLTPGWLTDHF